MIKNMEHFLYVDPNIRSINISASDDGPYLVTITPEADRDIKTHFDTPFEQDIITLPDNIKRFSPIFIRHNDAYLRQSTALSRSSRHSLRHREEVEIKTEDGIFFLTYPDVTFIDMPDSIDRIESVDDESINTNKFKAIGEANKGDVLSLDYYLNDSFCLIARENSYEIRLFTNFKELEIIYETNMETPFYTINRTKLANQVNDYLNINPHFNDISSGFLFITDEEHPVKKIESQYEEINLDIEPDVLNRNFIFKVKLLDRFNNPCYTSVNVSANQGTASFHHNGIDERIAEEGSKAYGSSDIYGNIYINYTPPLDFNEDTITISADEVEKTIPVKIEHHEDDVSYLFSAISISFPYHNEGVIVDQDILPVEVFAGDESFNPVPDQSIELKYIQYRDNKVLVTASITTDEQGRAIHYFKPDNILEGDIRRCYVRATYQDKNVIQDFKIIGTD